MNEVVLIDKLKFLLLAGEQELKAFQLRQGQAIRPTGQAVSASAVRTK